MLKLPDSNNEEKNIWLTLEEFLFLRIMGQFCSFKICSATRWSDQSRHQCNKVNITCMGWRTSITGVNAFNESSSTSYKRLTFNRLLILNTFVWNTVTVLCSARWQPLGGEKVALPSAYASTYRHKAGDDCAILGGLFKGHENVITLLNYLTSLPSAMHREKKNICKGHNQSGTLSLFSC